MKHTVSAFFDSEKVPLNRQSLDLPDLQQHGISLDLIRDDLLHPMIAGNKWWKLKYPLLQAEEQKISRLVTFGGAWSNHILAVAAAGHLFGFHTTGIIRGDEQRDLNPVLKQARDWGMQLEHISRDLYRRKNHPGYLEQLRKNCDPCLIIPEGGTSPQAVRGTAEMVSRLSGVHYDYLCCPVGTGGTVAGMILGAPRGIEIVGFSALKGGEFLVPAVENLLKNFDYNGCDWSIQNEFHFGGYARSTPELRQFCHEIESIHHVSLDLVYTGKMIFGINELARRGFIKKGAKIAAWHTGNAFGLACAKQGK